MKDNDVLVQYKIMRETLINLCHLDHDDTEKHVQMHGELVSTSITDGSPYASKTSFVKLLRSVKKETLNLIETFMDKAEDQPHIGDYARNVPDVRESEVLSLFATIINKYRATMLEDVPHIFEAVFPCTLEANSSC